MLVVAGKSVTGLAVATTFAAKAGFLAIAATTAVGTSFLAGMSGYVIEKKFNNEEIVVSEMFRSGINTAIKGGIAFVSGMALATAGAYSHLLAGGKFTFSKMITRSFTAFVFQFPWRKALY